MELLRLVWVGTVSTVAVGYGLYLLRHVAINTATIADLLAAVEDSIEICLCGPDEECTLCSLPPDDQNFQLGDEDEQQFRGIIQALGPEEVPDVEKE